jgi:hypothetical protein
MNRLTFAISALCLATWALAGPASVHAAEDQLRCEAHTEGGDLINFTCPVTGTGAAQRLRLSADFGGSHDDTTMSLKATLDGEPVECDPGSKTSSRFEDGEVRLECSFQLTAIRGTTRQLAITLLWNHAQLVSTGFESE